jgi:hypothetical protein
MAGNRQIRRHVRFAEKASAPLPIPIADHDVQCRHCRPSAMVSVRTACCIKHRPRRADGSRTAPRDGRISSHTSIGGRSTGETTAATCLASRSSRSPAGPHNRPGSRGEPAAIVIREPQPPFTELAPQNPILFDQVRDARRALRSSHPLSAITAICSVARSITSRTSYHGSKPRRLCPVLNSDTDHFARTIRA